MVKIVRTVQYLDKETNLWRVRDTPGAGMTHGRSHETRNLYDNKK